MSEELLVRHCAPTLAGMKTGNMFTCEYGSRDELRRDVRRLNGTLSRKGLRVLPLRYNGKRALIYIYRPSRLRRDLADSAASQILEKYGYEGTPERCIARLIKRVAACEEFPHEIGLFLGYPPEDVCGFMEKGAGECKLVGCWKVYGDAAAAQKTFDKYKKCTAAYCACYAAGRSIERLTVVG